MSFIINTQNPFDHIRLGTVHDIFASSIDNEDILRVGQEIYLPIRQKSGNAQKVTIRAKSNWKNLSDMIEKQEMWVAQPWHQMESKGDQLSFWAFSTDLKKAVANHKKDRLDPWGRLLNLGDVKPPVISTKFLLPLVLLFVELPEMVEGSRALLIVADDRKTTKRPSQQSMSFNVLQFLNISHVVGQDKYIKQEAKNFV